MPEKVSPAEAATRIAAFFYLLTSLLLFPVVLMVVQDLPALPRVTYSRYLDPIRLTHLPFEAVFLGLCFAGVFLLPLWRMLLASKFELNFMIVLTTAMAVYALGVFVVGNVYPISRFKFLSVCSDGYQICHPFGVYGYVMLLALTVAIAVARMGRSTTRNLSRQSEAR